MQTTIALTGAQFAALLAHGRALEVQRHEAVLIELSEGDPGQPQSNRSVFLTVKPQAMQLRANLALREYEPSGWEHRYFR